MGNPGQSNKTIIAKTSQQDPSMKTIPKYSSVALALGAWTTAAAIAQPSAPAELDRNNVVWTTPSKNAAGSMPIGNGEVALNVWVEQDGDLLFYIARTDAWSECNRLLKLGRVRVSLSPNPFVQGQPFRQELKLRDGQIVIAAGDATLRVLVDADAPMIYVTGESKTPRSVTAKLEMWRTERHVLTGVELQSSWTMNNAPASIEVWESPDVVSDSTPDAVLWHHHNEYSVVPLTLKHQGLETLANLVRDPLLDRTFGAQMSGKGLVKEGTSGLKSAAPMTQFALTIATHSAQTKTVAEWQGQLAAIAGKADATIAVQRTAAWWNAFWGRSWIFVKDESSAAPSPVTSAYILQRWITACAGRGNYPIKFNGSLFTVDPKFVDGPHWQEFSPDWRAWGDCYWWQNTRLPYFPMIARGDFDELPPLFRLYRDVLPLCNARAQIYHNAKGAYFPETMTIFGTYGNGDYGWDRQGRQPNEVLCPYWQYSWQQGLELVALMLDCYEYTEDPKFLNDDLIPMAHAVLLYFDSRFKRSLDGKLVISPTQAVETYWLDVVNDTPSVAGLNDVTGRLLALPATAVPAAEREYWQKIKAATPPVPLRTDAGKTWVPPAEKFNPQRSNCENPELYAIWPFRLFGVGRPNPETGVETFHHRAEKASFGWQYDGQSAALVGLADEAKAILLGKIRNSHPNFRFPAMWGPNYDWLPDQDHGSNIMLTLQSMVLATAGDKILVLPAWPQEWDVSFKLHAPRKTTVDCVYRKGKIEKLEVAPQSRAQDVVLPPWLTPTPGAPK